MHLDSPATSLFSIFFRLTMKKTSDFWITIPLCLGDHHCLVESPHKGPLLWKSSLCHDIIMNNLFSSTLNENSFYVNFCHLISRWSIFPDWRLSPRVLLSQRDGVFHAVCLPQRHLQQRVQHSRCRWMQALYTRYVTCFVCYTINTLSRWLSEGLQ